MPGVLAGVGLSVVLRPYFGLLVARLDLLCLVARVGLVEQWVWSRERPPKEVRDIPLSRQQMPSSSRLLRRIQFGMLALAFRVGWEERIVARGIATLAEADRRAMAQSDMRQWFTRLFRESLVPGGRAAATVGRHEMGAGRCSDHVPQPAGHQP